MTEPAGDHLKTQAAAAADTVVAGAGRASAAVSRPRAAETRRLYAADWAGFAAWCRQQEQRPLPAAAETVAAYLASLSTGLAPGALARRAAAIADRHRGTGHVSPGADAQVRAVLRAARAAAQLAAGAGAGAEGEAAAPRAARCPRTSTARPSAFRRAGAVRSAAEAAQLTRMAARCPGNLSGLRDRVLLLLAAAGIGGDQLLALDREHVRLTDHQLALRLPGADPEAVVVIPRGAAAASCPVRALDSWLGISDTRFGPVFRKVDRWGNVEQQRLRADGLRRIWQRRVVAARRSRSRTAAAS